jgi:hypothetical protein
MCLHLDEPIPFPKFGDYVEVARLAYNKVVAARIDRVSIADDDVPLALDISSHPHAADHAETVDSAVVELVLFAEVGFLERQIRVGEQLPAKVPRSLKAGELAAIAGCNGMIVASAAASSRGSRSRVSCAGCGELDCARARCLTCSRALKMGHVISVYELVIFSA